MSDINAYEYGLLQEQDNPAKDVKTIDMSDTNGTKLNELIEYMARNLPCSLNCPFNSDCEYHSKYTEVACRDRLTKFFETGE